jgi:uncharacterized protein (TIGR02145 family)
MKKCLLLIFVFCALNANAQTYLVSFAGTGASGTVNTVNVENLTAGTLLTLNGSDILRLTIATGINSINDGQSSELKIYPNPMMDMSVFEFYPAEEGNAIITVFDITGKPVAQSQDYLEKYKQEFRISGINSGYYLIIVKGSSYAYSGKLLCLGKTAGKIRIDKISNNQAVDEKVSKTDSKGVQAYVDMAYSAGDRLKFIGISGIYSTVITDIPASNKTITFNFIECTDGDNNNYPVVQIGSQWWMADNLKTTKYKDGSTGIPLKTDNTEWSNLVTPGYCWYNNDAATYKATYGALYNWYTAHTENLCPTGWHMPTDLEWTTLTDFLGGVSIAGGKLKETGLNHWFDPNDGATNATGYTALPGGYRSNGGTFSYIYSGGIWWSATESDVTIAWGRDISFGNSFVNRNYFNENLGLSVRCLQDF